MRTRVVMMVPVLWIAFDSVGLTQERPDSPCKMQDFKPEMPLAEVTAAEPSGAYYGSTCGKTCNPIKLALGEAIEVYRKQGDWTCGYHAGDEGAGPVWVRAKDLRLVDFDHHPTLNAWIGTWKLGKDRISIQKAEEEGGLQLRGEGSWHGIGDVVHVGEFAGEAAPSGNHLHFVEGDAQSCIVDLTLIGKFMLVGDNEQCGGMNVRFSGIWKRQ